MHFLESLVVDKFQVIEAVIKDQGNAGRGEDFTAIFDKINKLKHFFFLNMKKIVLFCFQF